MKIFAADGQIEDFFGQNPKTDKSERLRAAQMPKTHKPQKARSFSAHLPKAVKVVGAQNRRDTLC